MLVGKPGACRGRTFPETFSGLSPPCGQRHPTCSDNTCSCSIKLKAGFDSGSSLIASPVHVDGDAGRSAIVFASLCTPLESCPCCTNSGSTVPSLRECQRPEFSTAPRDDRGDGTRDSRDEMLLHRRQSNPRKPSDVVLTGRLVFA